MALTPPALGPVPEVTFVLQWAALGGAVGTIWALRLFKRTRDADLRWLAQARGASAGLGVGFVLLLLYLIVGIP